MLIGVSNIVMLFAAIGLLTTIVFYMLPTILSYKHKHVDAGMMFVVNLVVGWTLIGWVILYFMYKKKQKRLVSKLK